jgi:hypothetical protein
MANDVDAVIAALRRAARGGETPTIPLEDKGCEPLDQPAAACMDRALARNLELRGALREKSATPTSLGICARRSRISKRIGTRSKVVEFGYDRFGGGSRRPSQ